MGINELIIIIVAFGSFAGIYLFYRFRTMQKNIQERIDTAGSVGFIRNAGTSKVDAARNAGHDPQAGMTDLLSLPTNYNRSEYKKMFEQAGWNPRNAIKYVSLIKTFLVFASVIPVFILVNVIPKLAYQPFLIKLLIVGAAGIIGLMSFDYVMKFIISKRYNRISRDLHNALELLVVCSKAGMGVEKGMERVAQEVGQFNTALGKELLITSIELEVMPNRRIAYDNLRHRVDIPLIHAMCTTLLQAEEQGSSISESLRILSEEFRNQVLLNFERKAAKLPATLSIPVVLFTLPTLIMVILGPSIIQLIDEMG